VGYSDFITATGTDPLIPTEQSMEIIKSTKELSLAQQLGRRLPNLSRKTRTLKVEDTLASVYMVNGPSGTDPAGLKQTSTTSWRDVVLTAEELAVIVVISQEQLDDAMVPIWPEVQGQIAAKMAAAWDEAVFGGTVGGVAHFASWPTGGVRAHAVSAGNSGAIGAYTDVYEAILGETAAGVAGVEGMIEADGYQMTGALAAIDFKRKLRNCRDTDGQPIFNKLPGTGMQYELDGAPCLFPMNDSMPASTNVIVGQWDQLVWALRQDLTYTLNVDGVITDAAGKVTTNLFQQDSVALRAVMRIGFALPNPVNQVNETTATRSPFAVLTT